MIIRDLKRSLTFKAISLFMVFAFSFYSTGFAVTDDIVGSGSDAALTRIEGVQDIGIAIDSGTVKSRYSGGTEKVIVHIQDAHCNYEAQSNINKILDQVTKECGIDLISVEGAEGIVDTAWFRAFPDAEIRKEVATYFMKKGEITGAEFFSIISDYSGTIFGAETKEYYIKNLKAFTETYPYKQALEKYFTDLSTVANRIKTLVYTPQLRDFDSKIRAFDNKDMELSDYAAYMYKVASKNKVSLEEVPNFKKLLETLEYEKKIDFDIVDKERSEYIDKLSKQLKKEEMADLVTQSIRFKKGHIKAVDFYSYLRDLAKQQEIQLLQEYPNLFYYYIYTKLYDGIENEGLFKEIDIVERRVKEKLFTDDTQRVLDKHAATLDMYVDLVNIELTNEDYDLFNQYTGEFTLDDVLESLGRLSAKYNLNYTLGAVPQDVQDKIPNMVAFYEIAMKRDQALIDNTLGQMKKEGKDRCVLIAGGFHTRGIKDLLEKKGISYIVVTPKITKDVDTPYIKVLTNQRTSLEDIITESAAMPGVGITASREEILQPKRDLLAPVEIAFQGPNFSREDIKAISDAIGPVDGRTVIERYDDERRAMVTALVRGWLMQEKKDGAPEEWTAKVNNWQVLLFAFLKKYEKNAADLGVSDALTGLDLPYTQPGANIDSLTGKINQEFVEIFEQQVKDPELGRTSPGRNMFALDSVDKLNDKFQRPALDSIIQGLMEEKKFTTEELSVKAPRMDAAGNALETVVETMEVVSLNGFQQKIYEYNLSIDNNAALTAAERQERRLPTVIIHPGTGKGKWVRMYLDAEDRTVVDAGMLNRLGDHEYFHIVNPQLSEQDAYNALSEQDQMKDVAAAFNSSEVARQESREAAMLAENQGATNVITNISEARRLVDEYENIRGVGVVSGSQVDRDANEVRLKKMSPRLFNGNNSTMVISLLEQIGTKTKEGNFLGTLLAYSAIKEIAASEGVYYRDFVFLLGMLFGRGERMSFLTQQSGDRKPSIIVTAAGVELDGALVGFTAIEEALTYFTPVAKYLENRGFRGILDKWGDETEIASVDLTVAPEDPNEFAEYDVIKVVSVLKITPELAKEKDWVVFDEEGNMKAQLARNAMPVLIEQLTAMGIQPSADGSYYAGTSLGPVAVSYDVLDIAAEVFAGEITQDGVFFDFDPYLLMALAMKDDERGKWNAARDEEIEKEEKNFQKAVEEAKKAGLPEPEARKKGGIEALEIMVPDFFDKVQRVKKTFGDKQGRGLNLKILDLGAEVFWADIGQHSAMRDKFMAVNDKGPKGIIARKLENITGIRDENGNILVNSTIAPGVKVTNSVIVNSNITGKGVIDGAVIKDSILNDTEISGAFVVRSVRPIGRTVLGRRNGLYESMGYEDLVIAEAPDRINPETGKPEQNGVRQGTLLTSEGPVDLMVTELTNLRKKENTYNVPLVEKDVSIANTISFDDAYNEMFGISVEEIETRRAAVVIPLLIRSRNREDLDKYLQNLNAMGLVTGDLVAGIISELNMLNKENPSSRLRTELIYFSNILALKYGDTDAKIHAKNEKTILMAQGLGVTIDPDIHKRDSVRATAETEMPDKLIVASGRAYVELLAELRNKKPSEITISIGRESRESGSRIIRAFIKGAIAAGATVIDATNNEELITSTPIMYFVSKYLMNEQGEDIDGIIEITASHLPGDKNGLKPTVGALNFTSVEMQKWLEKTHDVIDRGEEPELEGKLAQAAVLEPYHVLLTAALEGSDEWLGYVEAVQKKEMTLSEAIEKIRPRAKAYAATKPLKGLKLAADSGFGSMGPIAAPLIAELGGELEDVRPDADYSKASGEHELAYDANPNNPDNLNKQLVGKVKAGGFNFGMGFDVDGDRLGIVTTDGKILRGDDISSIIAPVVIREAIAKAEREGISDYKPVVVANILCSDRLKKAVEKAGGILIESPVGFNAVKEVMAEHDAVMGVEISSHIMFKENFNADDAFFAVVKLLGVLRDKVAEYENEEAPSNLMDVMLEETDKELKIPMDFHTGEWRTPMVSNEARILVSDQIRAHYEQMAQENPETYSIRNTLDGIKVDITRDDKYLGFLAVRPSGTSPEMVVAINSLVDKASFDDIKKDFLAQLKIYKDYVKLDKLEPEQYGTEANAFISGPGTEAGRDSEGEKVMDSVYETLAPHFFSVFNEPKDLILPEQFFTRSGVGSKEWEEDQLNKFVRYHYEKAGRLDEYNDLVRKGEGKLIRIETYNAKVEHGEGGLDNAERIHIRKGATAVLVATEAAVDLARKAQNPGVAELLEGARGPLRVLTIPNLDKIEGEGWFFSREVEYTGIFMTAITPQAIQDKQPIVADFQRLMTQLTGRSISPEDVKYFLSWAELSSEFGNPFEWLSYLVQNLLLKMPIKKFDATEQLYQRRKVMWSV